MLNKERHRKQPLMVGKQSESLKFTNNIIKKNNTYGYESIRSIVEENNQDVKHPQIANHVEQSNNNLNTHKRYANKKSK